MDLLPIIEKDGVLVIRILENATINEGQATALRQSLYPMIQTTVAPRVAIDLSVIDYVSSTGIALLIGTKRRVEAGLGKLVLFGLHHDVLELFQVMKLVGLFEIANDESAALSRFAPPLPE